MHLRGVAEPFGGGHNPYPADVHERVRPRGRVHESKRVAFGFVLGLVDRFSSASQPPDRHRATSLPTQTLEIPYWRATAPWD
jgi:hypothetical protein